MTSLIVSSFCALLIPVSLTGAQILGVAYGLDIREASNLYIQDAKILVECFSETAYPGAYLVDMLPFRACTVFTSYLFPIITNEHSQVRSRVVPRWAVQAQSSRMAQVCRSRAKSTLRSSESAHSELARANLFKADTNKL